MARVQLEGRLLVTINVRQSGESEEYYIGTMLAPAFIGNDAAAREELAQKWEEWREAIPHPDSDSEFIDWLDLQTGWTRFDPPNCIVTIET